MKTHKKVITVVLILLVCLSWMVFEQVKSPSALDDYYASMSLDSTSPFTLTDYKFETTDASATLHLPQVLIGGVYVTKTITYNTDGSGEIVLELEGDGEYIEVIPKSFAGHVSDIEFSIEPDEIIDEDPIVKWMLDAIVQRTTMISIKVKEAGYTKGYAAAGVESFASVTNFLSGGDLDFSNVGKVAEKAGFKEGANVLLNHLEDFIFISDLSICANMKAYGDQYACLMLSISKHPTWYTCNNIFPHPHLVSLVAECESVKQNDPTICEHIIPESYYAEKNLELHTDQCILNYFTTKGLACYNLPEDEQELCITNLVEMKGYPESCYVLTPKDQERCLLMIEENNPESTVKEEVSEVVSLEPVTYGNYDCPIPQGAQQKVNPTKEYWMSDFGSLSGPYEIWYDESKNNMSQFECYNDQGHLEGIVMQWYKDGAVKKEMYYKDGQEEGIRKEWSTAGILERECSYKQGKKDGVCSSWFSDGTPKTSDNYLNDEKNGVCMSWYKNGNLRAEQHYKNDEYDGTYTSWYENSQIEEVITYENGERNGVHKEWTENGNLITEVYYQDDVRHGIVNKWYESGVFITECIYHEGVCSTCEHGLDCI